MTRPALGNPPEYGFGPVSRTDLVRYSGASGDFNPLHHDEGFARAAGLPGVMAHGMFSAGLLGYASTSSFSRWFSRAFGMSPVAWREAQRRELN